MKIEETKTGCLRIAAKTFADDRGIFSELYKPSEYDFLPPFVQENVSLSKAGVMRGMHFQKRNPQGKLIRILKGEVIDVVVDLRVGSLTYGKMEIFNLLPFSFSVFIPAGFAHGFWCVDDCIFLYHCTTEYDPISDGGINPIDKDMKYPWEGLDIIISEKDKKLPMLADFESPFRLGGV